MYDEQVCLYHGLLSNKAFDKGEREAEAVAQVKVELPAAPKLTIGNFRLVKEDDQWKAVTFGIKLFGIKIE